MFYGFPFVVIVNKIVVVVVIFFNSLTIKITLELYFSCLCVNNSRVLVYLYIHTLYIHAYVLFFYYCYCFRCIYALFSPTTINTHASHNIKEQNINKRCAAHTVNGKKKKNTKMNESSTNRK